MWASDYLVIISGPMMLYGSQVEIAGMYVTRIRKTNSTATNGAAAFTTRERLMPVIPEVTNRFKPIGGVIIPISMFTTMMIPK